jgi:hypothetical protein
MANDIILGEIPPMVADRWELLSSGVTTVDELKAIANRR